MNPYVNIHTHHVGEGINILDVGEGKAWVEKEEKRELVEGQNVFYSVGVHPMKLNELGESVFVGIEDTARMEKVIAIGECGLDRRSPIGMKTQEEILAVQVGLAEALRKPLIIHCVKAYSELIAMKRRTGSSVPWIVHGYNNNEQILRQLLNHGLYISVGAALLDSRSNAFRLLRMIPAERLFLENDDKEVEISVIYEAASAIFEVDVEVLKEITRNNYNKVFGK